MAKTFREFLLEEGLRQDALIHAASSQLGTKNALFLVFAAFVFSAESTLATARDRMGWRVPQFGLWLAALFSLLGIAMLLRCAFLEDYRMPPILPRLRVQAEKFFQLHAVKDLPDEQKMSEFQVKFINSLSRSIEENFNTNGEIARYMKDASVLVAISFLCLLVSLLWFPAIAAFRFFLGRL